MKNTSLALFLIAIAFVLSAASQPPESTKPLPDLHVKAGEMRTITAQRWEFQNVTIEPEGELAVDRGSTGTLHLVIRGNLKLNGLIVSQGSSSDEREIAVNIPGQREPLILQYTNTNKGGRGAQGGDMSRGRGGSGAVGTVDCGGGGGAGGGYNNRRDGRDYLDGASAQGDAGGAAGLCRQPGGDGGKRPEWGNGGAIFVELYGEFDGLGGLVNLAGTDGIAGGPSQPQGSSGQTRGCTYAASGGGGGSPGGQGGFLVVWFKGPLTTEYPTVVTIGGAGGEGRGNPFRGTKGERGRSGRVYWFPSALAPKVKPSVVKKKHS